MKATTVQERGGIMYQNILLEKEDSIAILSINRPEAMNALNKDTLLDINAALMTIPTLSYSLLPEQEISHS